MDIFTFVIVKVLVLASIVTFDVMIPASTPGPFQEIFTRIPLEKVQVKLTLPPLSIDVPDGFVEKSTSSGNE